MITDVIEKITCVNGKWFRYHFGYSEPFQVSEETAWETIKNCNLKCSFGSENLEVYDRFTV